MNTSHAMVRTLPSTARGLIADAAKYAAEANTFRSNIRAPKHAQKLLCARAVNKVIFGGQAVEEATVGLVQSERDYVELVVAEYVAWKSTENESPEQSPVVVEPVLVGAEER